MNSERKIFNLIDFEDTLSKLKSSGKKISLCHGHFNVVHPGHLRFLRNAKEHSDILIVSVYSDEELSSLNSEFFKQEDRALGVASLENVNYVILGQRGRLDCISKINPDFYFIGDEFKEKKQLIINEINAVKKYGGKFVFSSGDVNYSSSHLLNESAKSLKNERLNLFYQKCVKHKVSLSRLVEKIDQFNMTKMLVIGDTIVDQFVDCDTLGLSSEAPVMVLRELSTKMFIGGAAIVAAHMRSMGANVDFVSILGKDNIGEFVNNYLEDQKIGGCIIHDDEKPTTFKIRYLVENQKLLRVSRLKSNPISTKQEDKFLDFIRSNIKKYSGIVLSDFSYGVLTERLICEIKKLATENDIKIFGDSQSSSQIGDLNKYNNIFLTTPTEKEARIALSDKNCGLGKLAESLLNKTKNKYIAITLGAQGVLIYSKVEKTYESEHFPALESVPIDIAGAGDAMLAGFALSFCCDLNYAESTALASCMSAISVGRLGNIPIKPLELKNIISKIENLNKYSY